MYSIYYKSNNLYLERKRNIFNNFKDAVISGDRNYNYSDIKQETLSLINYN